MSMLLLGINRGRLLVSEVLPLNIEIDFFNFESFFNGLHQLLHQLIGHSQIITMLEQCHFNANLVGVTQSESELLQIGQTVHH